MTRRGECRHPMRDRVVLAHVTDGPLYDCNICRRCNTWLSLGPSNDAPDEVQVEMRAAEIAAGLADGGCEVSSLEAHGFNDTVPTLRGGYPVLINTSQQQAGHLAACIADHDRITEHRND
jgi:hypothetical protein